MLADDPDVQRGGSKSRSSTLNEYNITKDESSRWQRIAEVPWDEFDANLDRLCEERDDRVDLNRILELSPHGGDG